jgi:hypothetical protein
MFGAIVIRTPDDSLASYYDIDDPSHIFVITDWLEDLTMQKFVYHHHSVVSTICIVYDHHSVQSLIAAW